MSLDTQSVKKVARLARIRMEEDELANMVSPLSKIIGFIEQLSQVDTKNVQPLANVADITPDPREDRVTDGNYIEKILANAPETAQGYIVVPKVVE